MCCEISTLEQGELFCKGETIYVMEDIKADDEAPIINCLKKTCSTLAILALCLHVHISTPCTINTPTGTCTTSLNAQFTLHYGLPASLPQCLQRPDRAQSAIAARKERKGTQQWKGLSTTCRHTFIY